MSDPSVYPTGASPLTLAPSGMPNSSAGTAITPQLTSTTGSVNGDYFMYIRLAVSNPNGALAANPNPPTVTLQAQGGTPSTPLSDISQTYYLGTTYVADLSMVADTSAPLGNVWIIFVDFYPFTIVPPGGAPQDYNWTINLANNAAVPLDFTWVVSGTEANTLQPWIEIDPPTLAWNVLVTGSAGDSAQIVNRGTVAFTVNSLSPAPDPTLFTQITLPAALVPGDSQPLTVKFTAPATQPAPNGVTTAKATLNITPPDTVAQHNQILTLTPTTQTLEIMLLLDDSGSMSWDPMGNTLTATQQLTLSRWSELLSAVNAFLPLAQTFGMNGAQSLGTIGMARFPETNPADPTTFDLLHSTPISAASIASAATAVGAVTPFFAGTPMGDGLNRVVTTGPYFNTTPLGLANRRWLLLMTDGAQNIGTHLPQEFIPAPNGTGQVNLNALNISLFAAGYGVTGASNVDPVVLQNLANGSYQKGGIARADDQGQTATQIAAAFRTAIKNGIADGTSPGDPPAVFHAGQQAARFPILITAYDRKAAFVLAWNTCDASRMRLELITPACDVLTPESVQQGQFPGVTFVGGNRSQMYLIQPEFLSNTTYRYGTWTLVITCPELTRTKGTAFENYDYDVILDSDLRMTLSLDHSPCYAGDPITVSARILAGGVPVKNAAVTLSTTAPQQSEANWIASLTVPADALKQAGAQVAGDSSPLLIKTVAARLAGFTFPGGTSQKNIGMTDPGNIGTYSATITNTSTPETYTFYVTAIGLSPDGNNFRREAKISTEVLVRPDPLFTSLDLQFGEKGTVQAIVRAADGHGNVLLIDPGTINSLGLTVQGGRFTGPLVSNLDGTYTQPLTFEPGATPVVGVNFGGEPIIQQPLPPFDNLVWVDDVLSFVAGGEAGKGANLHSNPADALGDAITKPANTFVSLGAYGSLTVDVKGKVIQAHGSTDVAVFVQPDTDLRSYVVAALPVTAHDDGKDAWVTLGSSSGITSFFSLSSVHLTAARAIRITDTSGRTRGKDAKPLSTPGVSIRGIGVASTAASGTTGGGRGGRDTCIRLQVLNAQHKPLGGTVKIDFQPQDAGRPATVQSADASQDIDVGGLSRTPLGLYEVTVTPSNVFKPISQFVTIPASGFVTVQFVINE